jgi:serine/threonine protein kinase
MSLNSGTRVGAYEIVELLGAGGMGEVYRAKDTKLGRAVALKFLSEAVAGDSDRLARFQREAHVLAALNHTHIATIYGLEHEAGGQLPFLVMELVEGEDLSHRIARGAIPIDEAVPMATQIAEALEVAHNAGVIHRDLKPANIKVRPDGTVKVLDFGLAKIADSADSSSKNHSSLSPTITSPAQLTGQGVVLGTAAYMSPEQAKGRAVDKRADVWAFGAVLYEMLAGRRCFDGEDVSDTFAAILRATPNWSALPVATPPAIRRLIRRCLERDVHMRLSDMAMARIELHEAKTGSPEDAFRSDIGPPGQPLRSIQAPPVPCNDSSGDVHWNFSVVADASTRSSETASTTRPGPSGGSTIPDFQSRCRRHLAGWFSRGVRSESAALPARDGSGVGDTNARHRGATCPERATIAILFAGWTMVRVPPGRAVEESVGERRCADRHRQCAKLHRRQLGVGRSDFAGWWRITWHLPNCGRRGKSGAADYPSRRRSPDAAICASRW